MTLSGGTGPSGVMRMKGVSFSGEKEKEQWVQEQEEARKRDHRRIGKVSHSITLEHFPFPLISRFISDCFNAISESPLFRTKSCSSSMMLAQAAASSYQKELTFTTP